MKAAFPRTVAIGKEKTMCLFHLSILGFWFSFYLGGGGRWWGGKELKKRKAVVPRTVKQE